MLGRIMKYKLQNAKILTPTELLMKLCKCAALYSEYADTTLLFIFREKRTDASWINIVFEIELLFE